MGTRVKKKSRVASEVMLPPTHPAVKSAIKQVVLTLKFKATTITQQRSGWVSPTRSAPISETVQRASQMQSLRATCNGLGCRPR